jgi:hypothetical protein
VLEHHPVEPLLMDVRINTACYVIKYPIHKLLYSRKY